MVNKTYNNVAFTLVELIVVITILAILWTIAFISLQWYSAQARDSKRVSDIQNIKKSLELFSLNTGKYPEPDDYFTVSYEIQDLRYQWTVWEQVTINLSRNLNEKPMDPSTEIEYTYSRTYAWTEYEILSIYESDLISLISPQPPVKAGQASPTGEGVRTSIVSGIFAAPSSGANYSKIDWNYNWIYVKAGTYYIPTPSIISWNIWQNVNLKDNLTFLESQVITGWDNLHWVLTWWLDTMSVEVFSWELDTNLGEDDNGNKVLLAQALIDAYSGTILASDWVYKEIVETSSEDLISLVDNFVLNSNNYVNSTSWWEQIPGLITSTECSEAWWYWVESSNDMYIGSTRWNWFCISPRFWDWNDDNPAYIWWISFNWWWTYATYSYKWWNAINIDDTWNSRTDKWQTRYLDSYVSYDCKALWEASEDYEIEDTLVWRMKWLATTWNDYTEALIIAWIVQDLTDTPLSTINWHAIPALYIADCIDWIKDLTTDMTYIHNDNSIDEITYEEYNNDFLTEMAYDALGDITYQNRQKYLTAWTQQSWSHLPSAFSYIENGTAWWELIEWSTTNWSFYQNDEVKWEYQIACEAWKFWEVTWDDWTNQYIWANDNNDLETIWLSAVGGTSGIYWGWGYRTLGYDGCWYQYMVDSGNRSNTSSARFVVRP